MSPNVDAGPARRQLQELAARGFHAAWIADQIGMNRTTACDIRAGRRPLIQAYAARAIDRLHQQLADTTPDQAGLTANRHGAGAVANTLLLAARNGWTTTESPAAPFMKETAMTADTQLELFPASAVTGGGQPQPWPIIRPIDGEQPPTQDETLPLGDDSTPAGEAA
jgi:hypothetical protein